MPSAHDDVIERLEVALNSWNVEIAQMRGGLAAEIDKLGGQIDLLPRVEERPSEAEATQLKARITELESALQTQAANAAKLEQELRALSAARAPADDHATHRLAQALRDRDEAHQEIVALRAEVDLLRRANAGLSGPVPPPEGVAAMPVEVFDAEGRRRRLGEVLLDLGVIDEAQLQSALAEQTQSPQRKLGAILVENGVTGEDVIARILARQLGLPYVRLAANVPDRAAVRAISGELAAARECVPLAISPTCLMVAMANPFNLAAIEHIEAVAGRRVNPVVASAGDIREAVRRLYLEAEETRP